MITADTNVFIYSVDPADIQKQAIARLVVIKLRRIRGPLALQVVGEFQNVASRKLKAERAATARYALELFEGFETFPASWSAACAALNEMAAGRLSYWDALMLASAAETGCTVVLSEDMQDGATLLGLEIVNPFAANGVSRRAAELLGLA